MPSGIIDGNKIAAARTSSARTGYSSEFWDLRTYSGVQKHSQANLIYATTPEDF
jgi:hypothetical protein